MKAGSTQADTSTQLHQAAHLVRLAALDLADVGSLGRSSVVQIVERVAASLMEIAAALDSLAATCKEESP